MTLDNFKLLIRALVPGAGVKVDDTLLELLINKGVEDVNIYAAAYKDDKKFNVVAEQRTYSLNTNISDFVAMDEGGLWWNGGSGASPAWVKLDAHTKRSLNDQYPQWMNDDSADPLRYVQDGDDLQIDPVPDTSLSEGFWAFYIKKPTSMSDGTHYPFSGSTTEITALAVLDDAIIDYVRWKLNPVLGKDEKGVIVEKDYRQSLQDKISILKRRLDMTAQEARMRGISIE